jgi:hypothetical protein
MMADGGSCAELRGVSSRYTRKAISAVSYLMEGKSLEIERHEKEGWCKTHAEHHVRHSGSEECFFRRQHGRHNSTVSCRDNG